MNKEFHEDLCIESKVWVDNGIISPTQRDEIIASYDNEASSGFRVLSFLGSLFLCFSVLLLVFSNWEFFNLEIQLLILSFLCVLALLVGAHHYESAVERSERWCFLGAMLFGGVIWLGSEFLQYKISSREVFQLWAMGVLPLLYLFRSKAFLWLEYLLCLLWIILVYILHSSICLEFVPLYAYCAYVYFSQPVRGGGFSIAYIFGLYLWIQNLFLIVNPGAINVSTFFIHGLYLLAMFVAYGLASFQQKNSNEESGELFIVGLNGFLCAMLILTFKPVLHSLVQHSAGASVLSEAELIRFYIAPLIPCLLFQVYQVMKAVKGKAIGLITIAMQCAFIGLLFGVNASPGGIDNQLSTFFRSLLSIALFLVGILSIQFAMLTRQAVMYFSGVSLLLALSVARFYDVFVSYVAASIAFGIAGVILYVAGSFWSSQLENESS